MSRCAGAEETYVAMQTLVFFPRKPMLSCHHVTGDLNEFSGTERTSKKHARTDGSTIHVYIGSWWTVLPRPGWGLSEQVTYQSPTGTQGVPATTQSLGYSRVGREGVRCHKPRNADNQNLHTPSLADRYVGSKSRIQHTDHRMGSGGVFH
jgi:hypothetical protein